MKKIFLVVFTIILALSVDAQEYNHVDENGKRQGKWRKFHVDSEKLFYTGQFNNDVPVGEFTYYYKSGVVKGKMNYDDIGHHCKSIAYYPNGEVMAKGNYIDQKKDSTWQYFTQEKVLRSIDNWDRGVKQGEEITYYSDGKITEKIHWNKGLRDGLWEQNFKDGTPKVKGTYVDDNYEGQMTYYFPDGKVEIEGKYVNGFRDGTWYYYNEDGSIYMQTLYSQGKVIREKKETGVFSEYSADNVLISEISYVKGKKHGPFKIYYDGAEWVIENVYDPKMDESYDKRVLKGHTLKMSGQYKNDKLDGVVKHYNKAGIVVEEDKYVDGVRK